MNKLIFAGFIAFWSSVFTLLVLEALSDSGDDNSEGGQVFSLVQVAQHNRLDDCWMAIDGQVYDLTGYIPRHPTKPEVLQGWCGTDASRGMHTKGYGREHSPAAWEQLTQYRIGRLADSAP